MKHRLLSNSFSPSAGSTCARNAPNGTRRGSAEPCRVPGSGRFRCWRAVYGGCGRIPDTFYAQLDSGYFYEPMVSVSQLPRCSHVSLQVLSKELHPPDARREKFGHYFYKPLVFSRCDFSVQCQALQWIHVLRQCPGAYRVQPTFSTCWRIWILRMIPILLSGARRACPFNASVALFPW